MEAQHMNASEITAYTASIRPSYLSTMLGGILMIIFLIPGILGNVWIIYIIMKDRKLQANLINIFIASLCLNDLINLLFAQSLVVTSYIAHDWILGMFLCTLVPELNMILVGVSVWHHALISFHRYLVVVKWLFYKKVNKFIYKTLVILGTRIVPLTISLIFYILTLNRISNDSKEMGVGDLLVSGITSISELSNKQLRCLYKSTEKIRIFLIMIMLLFVPCLIVFASFTMIFIYVRKNNRTKMNKPLNSLNNSNELAPLKKMEQEKKQLARELSITRMFAVVFSLFLVGFAPYVLLRTFDKSSRLTKIIQKETGSPVDLEPDGIDPVVYVIFTVNYAIASCCNPIIFGCMNREIRTKSLKYFSAK